MLQMKLKDGTVFDPTEATWAFSPKGSEEVYSWKDIILIGVLDPVYDVVTGEFGPKAMPIRGVRFTDLSDLQIEVPMPIDAAFEMGKLLAESKLEVVSAMPSSLLLPRRLDA